jgi:hypothetical protein
MTLILYLTLKARKASSPEMFVNKAFLFSKMAVLLAAYLVDKTVFFSSFLVLYLGTLAITQPSYEGPSKVAEYGSLEMHEV